MSASGVERHARKGAGCQRAHRPGVDLRPIPPLLGFHPRGRPRQRARHGGFDNVLYHHVNVNDDKDAALADCGGGVAACGSRAA
jgi:hypothetical protein